MSRGKTAQERFVLRNKRPARPPRDSHRAWQTPGQGRARGIPGIPGPADASPPPTAQPRVPPDPAQPRAQPHLGALPAPPAPGRGPAQAAPPGQPQRYLRSRTGRRCFYAPFATAGKEAVAARRGRGRGSARPARERLR